MVVRFTTCIAGHGFVYDVGNEIDIDDVEAVRLLNAGFAVPVKSESSQETADAEVAGSESATVKVGRAKRGRS